MTPSAVAQNPKTASKHFPWPGTITARFVFFQTLRGAVFLALIFAIFVGVKALGYVAAYPDAHSRAMIASSFSSDIGISAILGVANNIQTVSGFVAWNCTMVMIIIGSIWAMLLATQTFRGEEESGHWELLLAGQTTARQAAGNALLGLGGSLVALYIVMALAFIFIGHDNSVGFGAGAAAFFALAVVAGCAQFLAIGAVASQLMPTRSRASSLGLIIFVIAFFLRASADTTSALYLLNYSPLGWIEKLQPLGNTQPLWLIPIFALTTILCLIAIYLAGKRDLNGSFFADQDTAKPNYALLNSPIGSFIRLTWGNSLSWLLSIVAGTLFFSLLTKAATQALNTSTSAQHIFDKLANTAQNLGALAFLSIALFLMMIAIMCYAASAVGAIRADEADGFLDNLLVRPVSRVRWLVERVALIVVTTIVAGLLVGLSCWAGLHNQHDITISWHTLLIAGLNTIAPAVLILGIGILTLSIMPRLTAIVSYSFIGWTFLVEMLKSGVNLSKWVLDTSIIHFMNLAPATDPNWHNNFIMIALGLVLFAIGVGIFNSRDLANA